MRSSGAAAPGPAQPPAPFQTLAKFDSEFRAGLGYHQPSGALASVGVMGAGSGATQSKYVARRETPVYIAENCTQCMECITACPDTALPNMAQDVVHCPPHRREQLRHRHPDGRAARRLKSPASTRPPARRWWPPTKDKLPFKDIIRSEINALLTVSDKTKAEFTASLRNSRWPTATSGDLRNLEKDIPAPAACSPSSSPISARVAASACRSAAITTRCA